MVKPRCTVRQDNPCELVLTAQRHMCRNEAMLHGIHDAPNGLDVDPGIGPDDRRYKEAKLRPEWPVGEGVSRCLHEASTLPQSLRHVVPTAAFAAIAATATKPSSSARQA